MVAIKNTLLGGAGGAISISIGNSRLDIRGRIFVCQVPSQYAMYKTEEKHASLRRSAIDVMTSRRQYYGPFVVDEVFEDYLWRMRANAEWAYNLTLHAISDSLKVNIRVHHLEQSDIRFLTPDSGQSKRTIELAFHNAHYGAGSCETERG